MIKKKGVFCPQSAFPGDSNHVLEFSTEGRVEFKFCSEQSSAECMILSVSSNTTRTPMFNKRKRVRKRNVKSHGIHGKKKQQQKKRIHAARTHPAMTFTGV